MKRIISGALLCLIPACDFSQPVVEGNSGLVPERASPSYVEHMRAELGEAGPSCEVDTIGVDMEWAEKKAGSFGYAGEITVIPLETARDALISVVTKSSFRDGLFYLFDGPQHRLAIFNLKGKFLGHVGMEGKGPGAVSRLDDFSLDYTSDRIALLDSDRKKIVICDKEGGFIKEFSVHHSYSALDWCAGRIFLSRIGGSCRRERIQAGCR